MWFQLTMLRQCIYALSDSVMGIIVLPTVLQYSKMLTKLTIGLDKRPDLVASWKQQGVGNSSQDPEKKGSMVEDSANVIREAFSKCLNDRSGTGPVRTSKPAGKRVGIYATANMLMKLFIQV